VQGGVAAWKPVGRPAVERFAPHTRRHARSVQRPSFGREGLTGVEGEGFALMSARCRCCRTWLIERPTVARSAGSLAGLQTHHSGRRCGRLRAARVLRSLSPVNPARSARGSACGLDWLRSLRSGHPGPQVGSRPGSQCEKGRAVGVERSRARALREERRRRREEERWARKAGPVVVTKLCDVEDCDGSCGLWHWL